jgi:nucleotide-binding universal stress UspA family protein
MPARHVNSSRICLFIRTNQIGRLLKTETSNKVRTNFVDIGSLIRSVQRAENKDACFEFGRGECNQADCKWRRYCIEDPGSLPPHAAAFSALDAREKISMRIHPKHILFCTDFSAVSNLALPYGIAIAREFDAKLHICHVIDLPPTGISSEIHLYPMEAQNRLLNQALDQIEHLMEGHPVNWEPLVLIGHTADEISRAAVVKKADLAISATRGRAGIKRLILGSVTERLMRILTCPLLIVRNPPDHLSVAGNQPFRFERILVGCDFSSDSALAFQHGISLAQEFQSELHLAHVIEPPLYKDLRKLGLDQEKKNQVILTGEIEKKLAGMVPKEAQNWCDLKTVLLDGEPYKELIGYAHRHRMALIILGVRGLSLMETLFLGSTTDRVVRGASCPVLTVRPPSTDKAP